MLTVRFAESAAEQFRWWERTNPKVAEKIKALLRDAREHPFSGLGKPEPLKENLSGFWSRRITGEHRLVYRVRDETIEVVQCRFHYGQRTK
jgi:toxin YoeB